MYASGGKDIVITHLKTKSTNKKLMY